MKRFLEIDVGGHDRGAVFKLLQDHGYVVRDVTEEILDAAESPQRSGHRCLDLFENAQIGFFRSTEDGELISANPAVARMLKYESPEEMIRLVNRRKIAAALYMNASHLRELMERVVRQEGWQFSEERFYCKDGSVITCDFHYRALPCRDGMPREFEGFVLDITRRKEADARLLLTKYCVDHAPVDISLLEPPTARIMYANEAMCRNLGYAPEELVAKTAMDLDPSLTVEKIAEFERLFSAGESIPPFETVHRRKDGTLFPIENVLKRLSFEGLDVVVCFAQDITKRKQAETMLKEQFHFLQQLLDSIPVPVFFKNVEGYYLGCNAAFESFFGLPRSQVVGKTVYGLAPRELADIYRDSDDLLLRNPGTQIYETVIELSDGTRHDVVFNKATFVETDGRIAGIVGAIVEITERKTVERSLQASLSEKEVLLKEIHHRVKNNLQIICSLLELQSDNLRDEHYRRVMVDSQNRIRTMALIHEKLYRSESLAIIDFREYIEDLVEYLFATSVRNPDLLELAVDVGEVSLGMDEAIPCGLIVNELLSNSLKHAFPCDRKGAISVQCHAEGDGLITLVVSDNGIGLPSGLDFRNTESLGLQLVTILVKQLRGDIEVGGAGTTFTIRFRSPARGETPSKAE
ncbi:MAG TPA: PAS domain S-box protein [Geobacteraceae bacterium]|nr:PAS domain S-box protein [Geobacteraceae bacterium]